MDVLALKFPVTELQYLSKVEWVEKSTIHIALKSKGIDGFLIVQEGVPVKKMN